jgi:hypothetical protein
MLIQWCFWMVVCLLVGIETASHWYNRRKMGQLKPLRAKPWQVFRPLRVQPWLLPPTPALNLHVRKQFKMVAIPFLSDVWQNCLRANLLTEAIMSWWKSANSWEQNCKIIYKCLQSKDWRIMTWCSRIKTHKFSDLRLSFMPGKIQSRWWKIIPNFLPVVSKSQRRFGSFKFQVSVTERKTCQ